MHSCIDQMYGCYCTYYWYKVPQRDFKEFRNLQERRNRCEPDNKHRVITLNIDQQPKLTAQELMSSQCRQFLPYKGKSLCRSQNSRHKHEFGHGVHTLHTLALSNFVITPQGSGAWSHGLLLISLTGRKLKVNEQIPPSK